MKTALIWILLLLGCQGFAQQTATDSFKPSMKYGKPSEEELAMTTYAPDTSATAVVLYSKCEVRYDLLANKLLHLATEYPTVKMFWENVAEKNNELIVLKKQ